MATNRVTNTSTLWVIIAVLTLALLVFNVIIPQVQKYNAKTASTKLEALAVQYSKAKTASEQEAIEAQIKSIQSKSVALSASAEFQWEGPGGGGTTGDCDALLRAAHYQWDSGNEQAGDTYLWLYLNCVRGITNYNND